MCDVCVPGFFMENSGQELEEKIQIATLATIAPTALRKPRLVRDESGVAKHSLDVVVQTRNVHTHAAENNMRAPTIPGFGRRRH